MSFLGPNCFLFSVDLPIKHDQVMRHEIPLTLQKASAQRKNEFLAGRYCAQMALKQAGFTQEITIAIKKDGSPEWPTGWVGSITHSKNFAMAAVASQQDLMGVGIDFTPYMSEADAQRVKRKILTAQEEKYILNAKDITFIFSAKESIYKCLNPLCGQFFGLLDAEIIHFSNQHFEFKLKKELSSEFKAGYKGTGLIQHNSQGVLTGFKLETFNEKKMNLV